MKRDKKRKVYAAGVFGLLASINRKKEKKVVGKRVKNMKKKPKNR